MVEKPGGDGGIDRRLLDLVSDSVRRDALVALNERIASATELSKKLGVDVATMTAHLEKMCEQGLIEVVDAFPSERAAERGYRARVRALWSTAEWSTLSIEERRRLSAWVVRMIVADADGALEAGTFNARSDSHASRTLSVVDERGWQELTRIQDEAMEASFAVQAASAERLAESGQDGIPVMSAMLCFEMAPGPG